MKTCTVNDNDQSPRQDIYARITGQIVTAPAIRHPQRAVDFLNGVQ
jgi:hypothetical protein